MPSRLPYNSVSRVLYVGHSYRHTLAESNIGPNLHTLLFSLAGRPTRESIYNMLRTILCRPLVLLSTTKDIQRVQRTFSTGRSSSPPFKVDLKRADNAMASNSILNAPLEERRSSEDVLNLGTASSFDLHALRTRFRELSNQSAILVRRRADAFTAKTASTFSQLGSHLNRVTGYEEIEALKRQVVEQGKSKSLSQGLPYIYGIYSTEARIAATRQAAREAKTVYGEAVVQRSNSQREVNDLLQRKSKWTDSDVSRFTTLVRQDHLYEQEEARAKAAMVSVDDAVDREFSRLCVLYSSSSVLLD